MLGPEGDRVWRDRLRTEAGAALGSVGLFGRDLRLADTAPRGGTATLVHRRGVGLELALADRWLTHVWTRGLDRDRSPRGTFVVDAATAAAPDGTLTVTLLRIDGRGRPSLEVARLDPRDGVGPISG